MSKQGSTQYKRNGTVNKAYCGACQLFYPLEETKPDKRGYPRCMKDGQRLRLKPRNSGNRKYREKTRLERNVKRY